MIRRRIVPLAAALALATAAPAAAQGLGVHPITERGKHSIQLSMTGGNTIGYWTRHSDRTDLGLDVGGSVGGGEDQRSYFITVTPALKRYHRTTAGLAPYTYFGLPLSYDLQTHDVAGSEDARTKVLTVGVTAGLGLDWLLLPWISVGGHVGVNAGYRRNSFDPGGNDARESFNLNTMSSGIRVHLYF